MRIAIAIVLLGLRASAQTPRPFTVDDLLRLERVGAPRVSANGRWVVLSASEIDVDANTRTPHLWIVPAGGGGEHEIVAGQDGDQPRWSPDGMRIAFVSRADGRPEIWIANLDDATGTVTGARAITSLATGAYQPTWSPDGQAILFVSDVDPTCADDACNAERQAAAAKSKVKAQVFSHLLFRHENAFVGSQRTHLFVAPASGAGPARDLTPGDYDVTDYAVSPDGQEICYTSNHEPDAAESINTDLWLIPVSGRAAARNITADNPTSDANPAYSPDGRYLAYLAQQRPRAEADRLRLTLYDRRTGAKTSLTEAFDRSIDAFAWAPDSKTLYFTADDSGQVPISRVAVTAPHVVTRIVSFGGTNGDLSVTPDGQHLLFSHMTVAAPPEIYRADIGSGGAAERITHFNDAVLAGISMASLESFWFTGAHADRVQGFLLRPPNFDAGKKYPVKLFLKGGPEEALGDRWLTYPNLQLYAANGYVVVVIHYHGTPGYGQRFVDAVTGDWGGAPFEDEMKGLDYAAAHYSFIDERRACAIGSSFGGYLANWILGHTDRFRCIVAHHSGFDAAMLWGTTDETHFMTWEFQGTPYANPAAYDRWSPARYAKRFRTPTLVIHGQRDYRVDVSQGFALFTTLQSLGVPSKMLYFPDEGQYPTKPQNVRVFYQTVNDWVDHWTR